MKINDTKQVQEVGKVEAASPAKPVASTQQPTDKVSVESTKHLEAAISAAKSSSGMDRAAKLQEIANAVRKGQYVPNASQIADRILAAAEVEAKLRAALKG